MSKVQQSEIQQNLRYYCECFSKLNVHKTEKRGKALKQPILLLSVIELIAQGIIKNKYISISEDLIDTFKKYWGILSPEAFEGSDLALPFFHLKNHHCKFWHLKYSSEYDGGRPQSIPKLKKDVEYASLDDELFDLLREESYRKELIDAIVSVWFSSKENRIEELLQINQDFQKYTGKIENLNESENLDTAPRWSLKKAIVRNAFFRKSVVHIYDYRCAFCRLKVSNVLNQNIVDGAHIKPFSQFYDSSITNGISLCKNHHWAFDQGWLAVDEQYKILVTSGLQEESPHAKPMKDFDGESLLLPTSEQYFPAIEALQWHRQNVFRA